LCLAGLALLAAAGCSSLPSQGPMASDIARDAATPEGVSRYAVVDLDERVVSILARSRPPTLRGHFGDQRRAPPAVIGVGDTVAITVFEAASGGLFSAPSFGGVTAGSHSASLPIQAVPRDGTVTVPYADRIQVVGLTPHQVEREIVKNLQGKAIDPQAIVSIAQSVSNSVTVSGEATNGARVPLTARGDRILDVIASAGGSRAPAHETFITLNRGTGSETVPLQALLDDPRENIFVHPGDVLTLIRKPRWFSAFGATGRNAIVNFDAPGMTLAEAIAKAGGLLDQGADPEGVFLMRPEPAAIASELKPDYPVEPGQQTVNVVYRANLRDANTYFLARSFAMRHQDILYVAGAQANQLQKALAVLGSATSAASSASLAKTQICGAANC